MPRQHRIIIAGTTFFPDRSGALYAPDFRTLLVSDLHLEQGASLARRGIHVPPYDTASTLSLLEQVIAATAPWRLVLLGDSFHDRIAHAQMPVEHAARLRAITSRIETIWVSGNHDPDPPAGLGGVCVGRHDLGGITLCHEPSRKLAGTSEIAGHLHPGAVIVQRGIATRTKCFIADQHRMIMPAFGSYTGALNVKSPAFASLFDEEHSSVWLLGRTAIHKFPLRRAS